MKMIGGMIIAKKYFTSFNDSYFSPMMRINMISPSEMKTSYLAFTIDQSLDYIIGVKIKMF